MSPADRVTRFPGARPESPMSWYGPQHNVSPKLSTCKSPKPVNMLCHMAKVRLRMWLSILRCKIILDDLGGLIIITRVLVRKRQECQTRRRRCNDKSRDQSDIIAGFEGGRGSWTEECSQPLKVGKGKKWILPKSLQKKHNPARTLILT